MRRDRSKEPNVDRLCWAMQRARLALRFPREERMRSVRLSVGSHWSEEGAKTSQPINLLSLYTGIVGRSLIAKAPRVLLSTFSQNNKPAVKAMQSWANKQIERMCFKETLERAVGDALFSIGVIKVGLASPAESARHAWNLHAGEPFAEPIDFDDFVFDIHARSFEQAEFIGHRIRVPIDAIKDSKLYSRGRKDLSPSQDQPFNLEGDERISMLGRTFYATDDQEFQDHVDLWEVYLPQHRLIYTLTEDNLTGASRGSSTVEPLRVQRWLGPDCGPYHVLGFRTIPGNIMPKGPVQDLVDLHCFINETYRKIMRQTARMKAVGLVGGGNEEDAARINKANDGESVQVANADSVQERPFGGPDQRLIAIMMDAIQRFSYMAGNLDMMGGLSPQSKTLGQDKMLEENASATVSDMQDRTTHYTGGVLKALCWYWWHDPFKVMQATHQIPGSDLQARTPVFPARGAQGMPQGAMRRTGAFEELDISVDPYSMQQATPQKRMGMLTQLVQQEIMPMMQLLQSQGIFFDANTYLQKRGEYMDMPDLQEIITIREPPPPAAGAAPGGGEPGMPQETTRNYVRESMPGRTQKGNDLNMVSSLMGVNPGGAPEANGAQR